MLLWPPLVPSSTPTMASFGTPRGGFFVTSARIIHSRLGSYGFASPQGRPYDECVCAVSAYATYTPRFWVGENARTTRKRSGTWTTRGRGISCQPNDPRGNVA